MNPLLVTFSPMIPTDVGLHNREEMLKLGFDHIFVRPNQRVARYLANRFFIERGKPKDSMGCWDKCCPYFNSNSVKYPTDFLCRAW